MAGLEGKSVIVTGGGTGIGAACARRLAAEGATVTICGRTESRLVDVAKGMDNMRYQVTDVTVEDDVAALVAGHVDAYGSLTGFVANAGGGGGMGPYHLQDTEEFLRVLHLNVLGTMLSVKHSVPHLVKSRGSFIGMSSLAGHRTHLWFGAYTVSKAGIEAMMQNAADEYGPVGVRFNTIRPGFISTEIMEGIPRDSPVYDSYLENTPLHGVGEPDDVANLARFLISDESRWITGQEIGVDGGHTLRRGPDFSAFINPDLGSLQ
ncbi:MAG: Short-chain dehydrogenase [Actinomycetia bacterium]|nr:Short-chain dehydrogenase [Actinomycetes bacterium]